MGFRFHLVGIRIDMMMELCQNTGWDSDFILWEIGIDMMMELCQRTRWASDFIWLELGLT